MEADSDGNMVEVPFEFEAYDEGGRDTVVFEIYAMTDAVAESIRNIVETAVANNHNVHQQTLFGLIDSDIASFFAGIRSAEDTARIIQNRVQTFLNEQS
jgi:primosomal protein N'